MKITWKGKRVLLLLLAMALLVAMLQPMEPLAFSEEMGEKPSTEDYKKHIGCDAWFAGYSTPLTNDPETAGNPLSVTPFNAYGYENIKLVIEECYYDATYDALWYKVKAAPGYTLPNEVELKPWVFQDYVLNPWGASLKIAEPETIAGTVTDSNGNPILGSDGQPLTVTVSGGLPEGAELKVSVPRIDGETLPNVFDIKIYDKDGKEWQPIDEGRTVTVSIPVDTDAEYVDVVHFIDYTPAINEKVEYLPLEGADTDALALLADAIVASEHEGYVAIEKADRVSVTAGCVAMEANSFSLYLWKDNSFVPQGSTTSTELPFPNGDIGSSQDDTIVYEYYATSDHQFTLTTETVVLGASSCAFSVVDQATITKSVEGSKTGTFYTTVKNVPSPTINREGWFRVHSATFTIPSTAAPGETIVFKFDATYQFYMVLHIVEPFTVDYQSPFVEVDSGMPSSVTDVTDGDPNKLLVTIPSSKPVPKDKHYTFVGWNTQPDGNGEYYEAGKSFNPMTSMTLYAIWNQEYSLLNFHTNGGFGVYEQDISVKTGSTYKLPAGPDRTGYEFMGWSSSPKGGGTIYKPGDDYLVNQDVTLYAVWGVKLTINAVGGTVKIQRPGEFSPTDLDSYKDTEGNLIFTSTTITGGKRYELVIVEGSMQNVIFFFNYSSDDQKLTRSFIGPESTLVFNDFNNETRATIDSQNGVVEATTIIFTAVNKESVSYTVTYDTKSNITIPPEIFQGKEGLVYTVNLPTPVRGGYTFLGWKPVANAGNWSANNTYTGTLTGKYGDVTLVAQWAFNSYTITFDSNGGGSVNNINYNVTEKNVPLPVPVRDGYIFTGWTAVSVEDGSWTVGNTYSGTFSEMYGNVKMVARWGVKVSASINNGGQIAVTLGGQSIAATENWSMDRIPVGYGAGATIRLTPSAKYRISQVLVNGVAQQTTDVYCYEYVVGTEGVLEALTIEVTTVSDNYTVTYVDKNGFASGKTTVESGSNLSLSVNPQHGYKFDGWYLNSDFSGSPVTELTNIKTDITVYAKWTLISYTVNFMEKQGNTTVKVPEMNPNPLTFTIETLPAVLQNPTRTGYTFGGWFADPECTGTAYTLLTILDELQSTSGETLVEKTIYAKWAVNEYKVTWIVDGVETEVAYDYGATIVKPADPVKDGYTFTGWDGYTAGMTMPAENLTFTAKFEQALTSLTIQVTGCNDSDQAFIFMVKSIEDNVELRVTVKGSNSVTIQGVTIGKNYTVTMEGWSWRYGAGFLVTQKINGDTNENLFAFDVTRSNDYWLDGNDYFPG